MSATAKPLTQSRPVADSPGDVDGLLRTYFQAALPQPWPAVPELATPPTRHTATLSRGRWALAASVLVLVVGHAVLSRTFSDAPFPSADRGHSQDVGTRPGIKSPGSNALTQPENRRSTSGGLLP